MKTVVYSVKFNQSFPCYTCEAEKVFQQVKLEVKMYLFTRNERTRIKAERLLTKNY